MPFSSSDARKIRNSRNRVEMSLATPMAAAVVGWQNDSNPPAVQDLFFNELQTLIEAERQISEMKFREINKAAATSSAINELTDASKEVLEDADKLKKHAKAIGELADLVGKITSAVTAMAALLP